MLQLCSIFLALRQPNRRDCVLGVVTLHTPEVRAWVVHISTSIGSDSTVIASAARSMPDSTSSILQVVAQRIGEGACRAVQASCAAAVGLIRAAHATGDARWEGDALRVCCARATDGVLDAVSVDCSI